MRAVRPGFGSGLASLLVFVFGSLVLGLLGCTRIPEGRTTVDEVQVRGAKKLSEGEVEERIATTETSKFLGLFRGILYEYSVFDRNVLQRDLLRVEAFYRSKGYYDARARAGRIHTIDESHVRVEIVVEEGEPVLVRNIRIEGLAGVSPEIVRIAEQAAAATLKQNEPFDEEAFDKSIGAVRRALSDRGYAHATVTNDAYVDVVHHTADVVLQVTPGPQCTFGEVTIEGLDTLPERPIRRTIAIRPGAPFSEATLDDAQQALLDLGVFASVEILPDLSDPSREVIPIRVKLEPSRLRTLKLGGGIEFDALKTDVHGLVGWEHRNFLGGLRTFSVTFRPGVVFYPIRVNNIVGPTDYLPEERLRFDLRQPGLFEPRTNGFIRPEFNVQALLLNPDPPPGQRVLGYAETRNAIGLDRAFGRLFGAISHNFQAAYPFNYIGDRDPTLGTLFISYPELLLNLDLRDDRVHPRSGIFVGNTFQAAGGPFFGQAADIKLQPDVRGYIPLHRRIVLAVRGSLGLLFPRNYGDVVRSPNPAAPPSEERTRDFQLTFFRGFFSGGPTSNRGYPLRSVGPHGFVPFLSSDIAASEAAINCRSEEDVRNRPECAEFAGFDFRSPTGGFTLWEASAELRFSIVGPLSAATFCDASDVSPRTANIRLRHLHFSCGAGARYDTPVGPVRVDIGYRIPGLQVIGGLTPEERKPSDLFGILPLAIHLGIGEAY